MLLSLRQLHLHLLSGDTVKGEREILKGIDLDIGHSETVALVGESGSGKSLTALSILRLVEENLRVRYSGQLLFEDTDILKLGEEEIRRLRGKRIAMIFQEPMTSLNPVFSVGSQLIEPLLLHRGMNRNEARQEAVQLLYRCGIKDPEEKLACLPSELSGGQRQRVMIAMALSCRPDLLVADEPTTALDVTVEGQIIELLRDLQKEFRMAILLITHDLHLVKRFARRVAIMEEGRIVEQGETAKVFKNPQHPYTRRLLAAVPGTASAKTKEGEQLLHIQNLSVKYPQRTPLLQYLKGKRNHLVAVRNLQLQLKTGSTCGIIGESGSGKSTLAMALLHLIPYDGEIYFSGVPLHTLTRKGLKPFRRDIQIVFQDPYSSLSPRFTILDVLMEGLNIHGIGENRRERTALCVEALKELAWMKVCCTDIPMPSLVASASGSPLPGHLS